MQSPPSVRHPVVVLGAGIQGVCAALALRREGYGVTLIDQAANCMLRTSLINEGKIHLGHVYANDATFRTSRLMLEAALQFAPLVERFVGHPVSWPALRSNPFTYVIADDSLIDSSELFSHYARLNQHYVDSRLRPGWHYLGARPDALWSHAPVPTPLNPRRAVAAVQTPEVSVDTQAFGALLRTALATSGIETLYGHSVNEVSRTTTGFRSGGTTDAGTAWSRDSHVLVNCLWAGRLAIDAQLGLLPPWRPAYRLKHRILVDLPPRLAGLPSVTIALGPFGDLVTYPRRRTAYISWYPACMRAWSTEIAVPATWTDVTAGAIDRDTAHAVIRDSLEAFDAIIPGMADCTNPRVAAGVIFAWGQSDIDDPTSQLHQRHEIGIHEQDHYFSIDTGKFTSAPLFADQLIHRLQKSC